MSKHTADDDKNQSEKFPGYPPYPKDEDIFSAGKELKDIDPEDLSTKVPNVDPDLPNELGFEDDLTGEDLDVPGNEDDEDEFSSGKEDEENNYYSLGGDNHDDLEESKD